MQKAIPYLVKGCDLSIIIVIAIGSVFDAQEKRTAKERHSLMLNRLTVLYKIPNALVHYYGATGLVYSVKNRIYALKDLANPRPILLGSIPWRASQVMSHIRLADRLLKYSILQVHEIADHSLIVSNRDSWWVLRPHRDAERISSFSKTRPMNRAICTSATGLTYIADYLPNEERREPIHVFRSKDFRSFEIAWTFPPGDIRHIHALIPDTEDPGRIWVLTGDRDPESRILYTDDDFGTLHVFLSSGQLTRATDLIVDNGNLIWGMDSPQETSYLISTSKENPPDPAKILELPGPAYYMTRNRAGAVYFGTTAEPGPSVRDPFGHIFGSKPDKSWEEILRRRKDPFPQHGIFYFPRGILPENYLVYSQRALVPQEGQMTIARDNVWNGRI
jgi:hypothetical protein